MASNEENDAVTMDKMESLIQRMSDVLRNEIKALESKMEVMNTKLDGNTVEMNERFAAVEERFFKSDPSLENKEMKSYSGTPTTTDYACTGINDLVISEQIVIEEQINSSEKNMNDCDYSEHEDDMSDLDDFESFNIINESEDSFSFDAKFSEFSIMDEQSELEIVNDIEVDWGKDIVFNHANIQPSKVKCLPLCSKNSCISQQGLKTMKHVATDVEVSSANVLSVEAELNSFAQFEVGLSRKVWDPGLDIILL